MGRDHENKTLAESDSFIRYLFKFNFGFSAKDDLPRYCGWKGQRVAEWAILCLPRGAQGFPQCCPFWCLSMCHTIPGENGIICWDQIVKCRSLSSDSFPTENNWSLLGCFLNVDSNLLLALTLVKPLFGPWFSKMLKCAWISYITHM